eukprot:11985207-Alexandrium_andersonii.AAC.1
MWRRGSSAGTSSRLPCSSSGKRSPSPWLCTGSSSVDTLSPTAPADGASSTPPMSACAGSTGEDPPASQAGGARALQPPQALGGS